MKGRQATGKPFCCSTLPDCKREPGEGLRPGSVGGQATAVNQAGKCRWQVPCYSQQMDGTHKNSHILKQTRHPQFLILSPLPTHLCHKPPLRILQDPLSYLDALRPPSFATVHVKCIPPPPPIYVYKKNLVLHSKPV